MSASVHAPSSPETTAQRMWATSGTVGLYLGRPIRRVQKELDLGQVSQWTLVIKGKANARTMASHWEVVERKHPEFSFLQHFSVLVFVVSQQA